MIRHNPDHANQTADVPQELTVLLLQRLANIESSLSLLVNQQTIKEWYTTAEIASILLKAEFTVREWCRLGRVNATKRQCGRGNTQEWIISHEELLRIQNHGLLRQPRLRFDP